MEFPSRPSASQLKNAARTKSMGPQTTSATFNISQVFAVTQFSEEQVCSPLNQGTPDFADVPAPFEKKKKKAGRELVGSALNDIDTGNSNEKNSEKAALQCNRVMAKLKCTDGHARRNILRKRQKIVEGQSEQDDDHSDSSDESEPVDLSTPPVVPSGIPQSIPSTPKKSKVPAVGKENRLTKSQMLNKHSTSIEKLCEAYERSTSKREAFVELKMNSNAESQKSSGFLMTSSEVVPVEGLPYILGDNESMQPFDAIQIDGTLNSSQAHS